MILIEEELKKVTKTGEGWEFRTTPCNPAWRVVNLSNGKTLIIPPANYNESEFMIEVSLDSEEKIYMFLLGYRQGVLQGRKEGIATLKNDLKVWLKE